MFHYIGLSCCVFRHVTMTMIMSCLCVSTMIVSFEGMPIAVSSEAATVVIPGHATTYIHLGASDSQ